MFVMHRAIDRDSQHTIHYAAFAHEERHNLAVRESGVLSVASVLFVLLTGRHASVGLFMSKPRQSCTAQSI